MFNSGVTGGSLKIDFLYWEECPSHGIALERLETALRQEKIQAEVKKVEILTEDDARRWSFSGSPTIRINGEDIDPEGARAQRVGLNCRIYHTPEGRVSPTPTEEMIRKAILRHAKERS